MERVYAKNKKELTKHVSYLFSDGIAVSPLKGGPQVYVA